MEPVTRVRRLFWATLAVTLAVKVALAASIPLLGDEAYFLLWGANPALGYYDHPPLVGWILAALLAVDDSLAWLRLPSVLLSTLIALGAVALLRPRSSGPNVRQSEMGDPELRGGRTGEAAAEERAWLVGTLILLLPVHLLGVFVLTDTPLVLFCFASGAALMRAAEDDHPGWYAASGAALGLAFLSKYLAVLLAAAYLAWFLLSPRSARRWRGIALLAGCAAPFVLFNLAWNATHCWVNVLFNLVSRHAGEGANYSVPRNLLFFAATHVYMATPPVLWYLWKRRRRLGEVLSGNPPASGNHSAMRLSAEAPPGHRIDRSWPAAALAFAVPMSFLLIFALTSVFGAYWVLPFYPFLFLLLHPLLDRRELRRAVAFMAVFAGLQVAVVAVVAAAPLESLRGAGFYDSLVTMERPGELLERIERAAADDPADPADPARQGGEEAVLAARGYSLASILSFARGETVPVFGPGTHYARQDDLLTDVRAWHGRRLAVVSKRQIPPEAVAPYFGDVRFEQVRLHGVTFHLAVGEGFDYPAYRAGVLETVGERHYRLPPWLPEPAGCPFCERYFGQTGCLD